MSQAVRMVFRSSLWGSLGRLSRVIMIHIIVGHCYKFWTFGSQTKSHVLSLSLTRAPTLSVSLSVVVSLWSCNQAQRICIWACMTCGLMSRGACAAFVPWPGLAPATAPAATPTASRRLHLPPEPQSKFDQHINIVFVVVVVPSHGISHRHVDEMLKFQQTKSRLTWCICCYCCCRVAVAVAVLLLLCCCCYSHVGAENIIS